MLGRLAKLASRSHQLRKMAMKKEALLGAVAKGLGGYALKNPMKVVGGGLMTAAVGGEGVSKAKQYKQGFNPQSPQQQLAGAPPGPPGA